MVDLTKLRVQRVIETGTMVFEPGDDNDFDRIENEIIEKFHNQDFSSFVTLVTDDDVFLHYKLVAEADNIKEFEEACEWLIQTMEELGATLGFVS